MGAQRTFASMAWSSKGKVTRRERFLAEMNAVIPWADLVGLIAPHYPKAGNGTQPYPLEQMLRIYCLQQWFNLSDPAAEEALYDSEAMRRFAQIELGEDAVPDETTILRFRHLLERHALTEEVFIEVTAQLDAKGLLLKAGTIVDATIVAAPSSTKNATETRDPEMHQTKKGHQWYFGMKVHAGMDRKGVVHTVTVTPANTADITELPNLLHGEERALWGDAAYAKEANRRAWAAQGKRYLANQRGTKTKPLTDHQKRVNRSRSRVRAFGEHPFQVMKCQWHFTKVRYRGLAKNLVRVYATFALVNLYRLRKRLLPKGFEPCLA
jgi:IS5 family transposase